MQSPPTDTQLQIRWLVDRAAIVDVMTEYTRAIDAQDFETMASLLAEEGRIEVPFDSFGREELAETVDRHLGSFGALQHQFSNPLVEVHGDEGSLRCNFEAVSVRDEPGDRGSPDHESVGGVYEVTLCREGGDWKLLRVKTNFLWVSGQQTIGGE